MKATLRHLFGVTAIATLLAVPPACGADEPAPETRLLVVDGIEITLAEVEPWLAYFDSFQPEAGRRSKLQHVLESHVLPVRFAQRAFPAERAAMREQALQVRQLATNAYELEKLTEQFEHRQRSTVTRTSARLPVSQFAFDPLATGSVSEPLEVDLGWFLVGTFELDQAALVLGDYANVLQVGFVTHPSAEFDAWWAAEKQRIADKVTFVHPDHRTSLPTWLHLPKLP